MFLDEYGARAASDPAPAARPSLPFLTRRGFVAGAGAGGLALGVMLAAGPVKADSTAGGLSNVRGGDATPSLFVEITPEGAVKITCHRSEMGQQVWTSMAQIIADEMEAEWSTVEIVQAIGHPRYGDQNTDGSRSVRRNLHRLRVTGAAMRGMLVAAAAAEWGVDPSTCRAEQGVVSGPGGQTAEYGALSARAAEQPLPAETEIKLKTRSEWRYIGKPTPSLTVPMVTRGEGTFGQDVVLPDMLYAVVARPPQVFGRVSKADDAAALKVAGVVKTVALPALEPPALFKPLGGVAVIARDTWAAIEGRRALEIEWDAGANADYDSESFAEAMMETARKPGAVRRNHGDVDAAFSSAAKRVEAEYYIPHLSHSQMEPPAATARWTEDGKVECWACVQAPQETRSAVAQGCGVAEDDVTINVTWLGGGFGRKSKPDFVVEAALIAREAGKPVKVIWTREDDVQHGYYHSVSAQRMEGGLDENGKCVAFLHRTVFPPIGSTFSPGLSTPTWGELRMGASDNPFAVPNMRLETGDAPGKIRIGWLRSVANIYHAFAVLSFAAELAAAAGRDQKDYLLELIGPPRHVDPTKDGAEYDNYGDPIDEYPIDTGRLANVVRVAADMAGWGRSLPKGHGFGIAAHRSFLSYVATVVEVAVDEDGALTIPNIWSAIDAGTVVNPRHTEAQVEGGTLFGISNALFGAITAKNGAVEQKNFPDFRLMRMNEAPRAMAVKVIESDAPPGGVGEPPTPPAAPALANAIFAATGLRIRKLPVFGADRSNRLDLGSIKGA
jgi:isoquinoline 1-oxidoreductase subunit beta